MVGDFGQVFGQRRRQLHRSRQHAQHRARTSWRRLVERPSPEDIGTSPESAEGCVHSARPRHCRRRSGSRTGHKNPKRRIGVDVLRDPQSSLSEPRHWLLEGVMEPGSVGRMKRTNGGTQGPFGSRDIAALLAEPIRCVPALVECRRRTPRARSDDLTPQRREGRAALRRREEAEARAGPAEAAGSSSCFWSHPVRRCRRAHLRGRLADMNARPSQLRNPVYPGQVSSATMGK